MARLTVLSLVAAAALLLAGNPALGALPKVPTIPLPDSKIEITLLAPGIVAAHSIPLVGGVSEIPFSEIWVLVDGSPTVRTRPDPSGRWEVGVPIGAPRNAILEAAVFLGLPTEMRSKSVAVVVAAPPDAPASATTATVPNQLASLVTWTAPPANGGAPIRSYVVYRSTNGGAFFFHRAVPESPQSFLDIFVLPDVRYEYRVAASNLAGTGPATDAPWGGASPDTPVNLVAVSTATGVRLTWETGGAVPVSMWRVYRAEGAGPLALFATLAGAARLFDSPIPGPNTYRYTIAALNVRGESSPTPETSLTVNLPSAPLNLAAAPGPGYAELTWEAPSDTGGGPLRTYLLERGVGSSWVKVTDALVLGANNSGIAQNVTHTWRVRAANAAGFGPASEVTATTPWAPPSVVASIGTIRLCYQDATPQTVCFDSSATANIANVGPIDITVTYAGVYDNADRETGIPTSGSVVLVATCGGGTSCPPDLVEQTKPWSGITNGGGAFGGSVGTFRWQTPPNSGRCDRLEFTVNADVGGLSTAGLRAISICKP